MLKIATKILLTIILITAMLLLASCANTNINWPGVNEILKNLKANLYWISRLLVGFSYLAGLFLVYNAVHRLRAFGQVRTMMPSHAELAGPMIQFFIGAVMIFLPTFINISVYSLWGSEGLAPYPDYSSEHLDKDAWDAVFGVVRIMGFIALIRGLMLMARASKKGGQPGMFGKGMTHLVGGILAINIGGTIDMIKASFGIT